MGPKIKITSTEIVYPVIHFVHAPYHLITLFLITVTDSSMDC